MAAKPQRTESLEPHTSVSAQDEILRFAALDVAVGIMTETEITDLGRDGLDRLGRNINYDVQTRRLRAYGN